jgi:hypothetical protein
MLEAGPTSLGVGLRLCGVLCDPPLGVMVHDRKGVRDCMQPGAFRGRSFPDVSGRGER